MKSALLSQICDTAIDTYSLYITWFYCRVSGRTGVSVLSQFLEVIHVQGIMPLHLRADRGTETMMVADAFWQLHLHHNPSLNFDELFFYGTSTRNIKIESWWSQLTKGATVEWKVSSN